VVLDEPPSIDAREITDKGSLNQKAVLQHRQAVLEALYAPEPPSHIIAVSAVPS
jgi:feruloyl-CoA synthase